MEGREEEPTWTFRDGDEGPTGLQLVAFGDGWSRVYDLGAAPRELVIGRDESCGVRVDDRSVSRRHATLSVGAQVVVTDLGSANGVAIDGARLAPHASAALRPGARLSLGAVSLVLYGEPRGGALEEEELPAGDPLREVHALCDRVATSALPVLLVGETGTGKELLAERIHRRSARGRGPFVRVTTAALPAPIAEGQLFGYEQPSLGAGASAKDGLVAAAHGGTLLLDEVGDLPPAVQSKLLRVVETGAMFRVGATRESHADVRWIATTSRDVGGLVASGALRHDLVYRLAGVTIEVPPLRARATAVVPLARRLLLAAAGPRAELTTSAERAIMAHPWPGNVRELKATMLRAAVLAESGRVDAEHLALGALRLEPAARDLAAGAAQAMPPPRTLDAPPPDGELRAGVEAVEKERILAALAAAGGNQSRAAEMLGISRRTLGAKLDKWNLVRPRKPR